VTGCGGQGVKRRSRSGSRASPGGRVGAALPRIRGPLDQADRRPPRSLAGDGQGVFLRPHRGEGADGQGALPGSVPRLRAYTQPRNGKGDAYAYCKACHPGAIERRWTRERVLDAMRAWRARYGRLPSSYDWSRTHARRRGGEALERLRDGDWPSASVVTDVYGAGRRHASQPWNRLSRPVTESPDQRIVRRGVGPAGRQQRSPSRRSRPPRKSSVGARLRAGNPVSRSKSQTRFENGAESCEHPDRRAARAAAGPGTCPGIGLGPFVRYGGGAGSADRADAAGGIHLAWV
jgi:hypothetical protein